MGGPLGIKSLMTTDQIAEYLGVKAHTIRVWACRGEIPFVKVGRCTRYKFDVIERWINKHTKHSKQSSDVTNGN